MKSRTSNITKCRFARSNTTTNQANQTNRNQVPCVCIYVFLDACVAKRDTFSVFFAEILFAGEAQCVCLSVLIARADLTPLSFRIRWSHWGCGCGCVVVDVEAGLAEEDAGANALHVAVGMDRVLGELCCCLTKAAVAGSHSTHSLCFISALTRELPRSSRNILRFFFGLSSTLDECGSATHALYADTARML